MIERLKERKEREMDETDSVGGGGVVESPQSQGPAPPSQQPSVPPPPGSSSVPSSSSTTPPNKDFGSTHRVKKLLETYIGSASRTLTGPANTGIEVRRETRIIQSVPHAKLSKQNVYSSSLISSKS